MRSLDVTIVGAGPAGIGMALALNKLPGIGFAVLEQGDVGESLRRWPAQTRFITPSFYSNPFGLADLNAVDETSSPAALCGAEHPSGAQYADYLASLVAEHALPVVGYCKVQQVASGPAGGFVLTTEQGEFHSRFVVWATGEYQFPELNPFPGADHCVHYAQVANWADFETSNHTVIGGFESGIDAAVQLVELGRAVRLLVRKPTWDSAQSLDPSHSLSPYTRSRLYQAADTGLLEVVLGADIREVTPGTEDGYRIHAADGRSWHTAQSPILCTGFTRGGGARQIADLWEWTDQAHVVTNDRDESTRTPGLFLVGPQLRQTQHVFCFIYKFRQRFSLIAAEIARQLRLDPSMLNASQSAWGPFGNPECCEDCEC